MSRERLIELVEDGNLDAAMAVTMCAKWMTDDEVAEMLDANELSERFEDDGQPDEAQEWADFDPDCQFGKLGVDNGMARCYTVYNKKLGGQDENNNNRN